jgi:hypothetical protein
MRERYVNEGKKRGARDRNGKRAGITKLKD